MKIYEKKAPRVLAEMKVRRQWFDGFGIGGSFTKEDMNTAVAWVNEILPEEKPRHLLGIGEPLDLFNAVENGCDFLIVSRRHVWAVMALFTLSSGKFILKMLNILMIFHQLKKIVAAIRASITPKPILLIYFGAKKCWPAP
jgi:tRNA-guanine family transglycosylase